MKAIVCPRYGTPDVLEPREVPTPRYGEHDVLVRVRATTVARDDCSFLSGEPFAARLYSGLLRPRFSVQGSLFSGEVDAVGAGVTRFAEGDRVFGLSPRDFGTQAEYLRVPEDAVMARRESGMTHEEAACLLEATTALTLLRDVARVRGGQRVLVNGASGSVGCYAVQLAKHLGAEVTGVCGPANTEALYALGADRVLDYTRDDFTRGAERYDVVLDAAGRSSFTRCRRVLTRRGAYLSVNPTPGTLLHVLLTSPGRGRRARFAATGLMQRPENLVFLDSLFASGGIRAVVDGSHPLERTADAYRRVERGGRMGSVVVTV
ncbi:hypothetical protein A6A08_22290 [Nocardiopsis sp. TSRI0078]|uniref:NAD(P)-dependent alcohol dehydrogenase n=1 Tax=unclassified Nocardiopsis TaxID=2649073 RepID=UPI00093A72B9|nr:NAD(P)-dependent alcohol dehydrogenase [Nocardiopsis sp. TSRI0078]OKI20713.1 hypothetical protein A6A08_22290 [Nocardiopsis sp. TSRI0078]